MPNPTSICAVGRYHDVQNLVFEFHETRQVVNQISDFLSEFREFRRNMKKSRLAAGNSAKKKAGTSFESPKTPRPTCASPAASKPSSASTSTCTSSATGTTRTPMCAVAVDASWGAWPRRRGVPSLLPSNKGTTLFSRAPKTARRHRVATHTKGEGGRREPIRSIRRPAFLELRRGQKK